MNTILIFLSLTIIILLVMLLLKTRGIKTNSREGLNESNVSLLSGNIRTDDSNMVTANHIDGFILTNENSKDELIFDFIPSENLKNYDFQNFQVTSTNDHQLESFLSSVLGTSANIGLSSLATKGLFKATADPAVLMKLADGSFSTAIRSGGKIFKHSGFIKSGASIATPLVIFQAMSFVTGQYYMQSITKQLNAVIDKLDQILSYQDSRDKGTLKSYADKLTEFSEKDSFVEEDFNELRYIKSDIKKIRETYFIECEKLNLREKDYTSGFKMTNFGRFEHIVNKFQEKGYLNKLNILLFAENILVFSNMVEVMMNVKYCSKNESQNRINALRENIQLWNDNPKGNINETMSMYQTMKDKLNQTLTPLSIDAVFYEESFSKLSSELEQQKIQYDSQINSLMGSIDAMISHIKTTFEMKKEIIIDCRGEKPKLLIEL